MLAAGAMLAGCSTPGSGERDASTAPPRDAGPIDRSDAALSLADAPSAASDAGIAREWPAWRRGLGLHTITDITADGSTAASAFRAAGYDLPGWAGDASTNLSAWAGGVLAPLVGEWGSMLCGSNGHELEPASTIHRFDLATATWVAPIGAPRLHRQVAPDYLPPPADAEIWFNPEGHGGLPFLTWDEVVGTERTTPFNVGGYSFPYWPPRVGLRYDTNVGSAMRYDNYALIPPSCGGDSRGTLAFVAPGVVHEYNHVGTSHTWSFGLGVEDWLPHSLDRMDEHVAASYGISTMSALSEKHEKVFTANAAHMHMGIYDPRTNAHGRAKANSDLSAYTVESSACVTEGHDAHLFICFGESRGGSGRCLWVADLDEVMARPFDESSTAAWSIENVGSPAADPSRRRVPLLTPAVVHATMGGRHTAWSRARQKLILFHDPRDHDPERADRWCSELADPAVGGGVPGDVARPGDVRDPRRRRLQRLQALLVERGARLRDLGRRSGVGAGAGDPDLLTRV
jgi:hypothetical protein